MQPGDRDVRHAGESVGAGEQPCTAHAAVPGSVAARDRAVRRPRRAPRIQTQVGEPLKRSSIFAGVVALAMVLATLGLVRAPTPESREAAKLRAIAQEIAQTATSSDDKALADKIRHAADALENSKLPPEEKRSASKKRCGRPTRPLKSATTASPEKIKATASPTRRTERAAATARARVTPPAQAPARARAGREPVRTAGGNNPGSGKGGAETIQARTTAEKGRRRTTRTKQERPDQYRTQQRTGQS